MNKKEKKNKKKRKQNRKKKKILNIYCESGLVGYDAGFTHRKSRVRIPAPVQKKTHFIRRKIVRAFSGGLAQLEERVVSNDEAPGSKPGFSISICIYMCFIDFFFFSFFLSFFLFFKNKIN